MPTFYTESLSYEYILFEKIDKVGVITLNRPQALNALSEGLGCELQHALENCESDPEIHCMLLMGLDTVFSAGADIKEMQHKAYIDVYKGSTIIKGWDKVSTLRKPIIAAVSGYALGGGCELAMICDFIIASDTAKFGQPEVTIGTIPAAGGTQRLVSSIGKAKAMDLCLTGRFIDAMEAEKMGLVSRVVPVERLREEALKTAEKIASYSLPVLMMIKESIGCSFEVPLSEGLKFERCLSQATFALEDQKEGMTAFMEKRQPNFKDQ